MTILIFVSLVLFILLSFLFMCLVYPVLALVRCAISDVSNKQKTIWIIIMVLFWPLGSFIYGLFASRMKLLQVLVVIFLAFSLACLGMVIGTVGFFLKDFSISTQTLTGDLNNTDTSELTAQEVDDLNGQLSTLE